MIMESKSPIVKHLVNRLRDAHCDAFTFRWLLKETAKQLLTECAEALPMSERKVPTWQGNYVGSFVDESKIVCVSILRAALPMQEGVMETLGEIEGGFLAMKRDEETHESRLYYDRIPDPKGKTVLLVDPMVATGGSLHDALELLLAREPEKIVTLNVIGAKEGVEKIAAAFPDVTVHIAQIDPVLNKDAYIVPGLGDAGDRAFNTPE
ncbi:uracil phosphoribosyltransferase [Hydrogenimonas cancrithermarum]|uniref:Uracil phosphoribosyltransferase n=1 Tax=Hydrogenimonas cancrithermarum TaxID=2993563 RepID=A0ABN6WU42_9BACT|nr:uracil phosphoribosyltransferase [Hydrogenimonas cancrithermarum]BDY12606.1 uracil phosphoribosyltransferase [Hydrogenimonas cancrithermarum]